MRTNWMFEIVQAETWSLSFDHFEDGSAYWAHVGHVCFTFGYIGTLPVPQLTRERALAAIKRWWSKGTLIDSVARRSPWD